MSKRISTAVSRPEPVVIEVNGVAISAHAGESIATALLAAGVLTFSRDVSGRPHSVYCNMGVCFACMVEVERAGKQNAASAARVRACLTPVEAGMRITVPES
jgi:ferredoxin